jgi:hypothetical protein
VSTLVPIDMLSHNKYHDEPHGLANRIPEFCIVYTHRVMTGSRLTCHISC